MAWSRVLNNVVQVTYGYAYACTRVRCISRMDIIMLTLRRPMRALWKKSLWYQYSTRMEVQSPDIKPLIADYMHFNMDP